MNSDYMSHFPKKTRFDFSSSHRCHTVVFAWRYHILCGADDDDDSFQLSCRLSVEQLRMSVEAAGYYYDFPLARLYVFRTHWPYSILLLI